MHFPEEYERILKSDPDYYADTFLLIKTIKPLIKEKPEFFPEYTDHSFRHNSDVLETCLDIITEEAKEVITAADIYILTAAVLLHDLAMHISMDGFISSVISQSTICFPELDKHSWMNLWKDYCSEVKRWDEKKIFAVTGRAESISLEDLSDWEVNKGRRLVIGEFVRRHHGRLAHEIALHGFPGLDGNWIEILENRSSRIKDLIGFIARSHSMSLRSTLKFIQKRKLRVFGKNIHPVYLMVLLRISDYLQIRKERVSMIELGIRQIHSPISKTEWALNNCVEGPDVGEDPEALIFTAYPEDVDTYLRFESWFNGFQDELDKSWAVLGEVYGRYKKEKFDKLGITLRRVKSNIEDHKEFQSGVDYVTEAISFEVANKELLTLLTKPLYGDAPEVGVRELLQNSIDAVRERQSLAWELPLGVEPNATKADIEMLVEFDNADGKDKFIIRDNGVGMTLDTLKNYFLQIGSTFRRSDYWKSRFSDDDGKPKVLRSGKFGIGVIAAFLLGEELRVTTRHVSSEPWEGIQFTTTLSDRYLELKRVSCPPGTTIEVFSKASRKQLFGNYYLWDWYCLDKPIVKRFWKNLDNEIPQKWSLPALHKGESNSWAVLDSTNYGLIYWCYTDAPQLVINGLEIRLKSQLKRFLYIPQSDFRIRIPSIMAFDYEAKLPLNLQRDSFELPGLPFENELMKMVIKSMIAKMVVNVKTIGFTNERDNFLGQNSYFNKELIYSKTQYSTYTTGQVFYSKNGCGLYHPTIISFFRPKSIVVISKELLKLLSVRLVDLLEDGEMVLMFESSSNLFDVVTSRICYSLGMESHTNMDGLRVVGYNSNLEATKKDKLTFGKKNKDYPQVIEQNGEFATTLSYGKAPENDTIFDQVFQLIEDANVPIGRSILCKWYRPLLPELDLEKPDFLLKIWKDCIGEKVIPFSINGVDPQKDSLFNWAKGKDNGVGEVGRDNETEEFLAELRRVRKKRKSIESAQKTLDFENLDEYSEDDYDDLAETDYEEDDEELESNED